MASKPKSQNPKQHFEDKNILFESRRSLDQHKDTGDVWQLTKTAIFMVTPIKSIFGSSFYQWVFFVNLLTENLWV